MSTEIITDNVTSTPPEVPPVTDEVVTGQGLNHFILVSMVDARDPGNADVPGMMIPVFDNSRVTNEMVTNFIQDMNVAMMPDKRTTVVVARLRNDYLVVESSTCLKEEDYDQDTAIQACQTKIFNKVRELLAFMLASATMRPQALQQDNVEPQEPTAEME